MRIASAQPLGTVFVSAIILGSFCNAVNITMLRDSCGLLGECFFFVIEAPHLFLPNDLLFTSHPDFSIPLLQPTLFSPTIQIFFQYIAVFVTAQIRQALSAILIQVMSLVLGAQYA